MQKKPNFLALLTLGLTALSVTIFILLVPQNIDKIIEFGVAHPVLAPVLIVAWRMLAIIIPPIPGGVVSWAFLPAFGWFWSFIFAATGMLSGTVIAFFLARRYREKLVNKFVPLQEFKTWEEKLSNKTEFFGFLILRFTTGPVMDFVSYVAGLSKISFKQFFIATVISLLPDALLYYLGGEVYKTVYKENAYWSFATLALFALAIYILYKRKFFKKT
jgi:uncharacterized membrane protein YdjX (TVP38/TMEM64 family)